MLDIDSEIILFVVKLYYLVVAYGMPDFRGNLQIIKTRVQINFVNHSVVSFKYFSQ